MVRSRLRAWAAPLLVVVVVLGAWEAWVRVAGTPGYLVPAPSAVAARLAAEPGYLLSEGARTLGGALGGLAIAAAAAVLFAAAMGHWRPLEAALMPWAVVAKVTPIVAVAPLFVIWFGFTPLPKVLVAALVAFFPILVGGVTGFRSADPAALDLLRSLAASDLQVFLKLRLPGALPFLFAGVKVSVPLCVIGSVVAEWVGAGSGLGQAILQANNTLDMAGLFAAIVVLATMGLALMGLVYLAERRLLFWHASSFGG
jgi:NitT/TauT family transport system permease protein